jgi:aldose 1-epimerase
MLQFRNSFWPPELNGALCGNGLQEGMSGNKSIAKAPFGLTPDGTAVDLFTLRRGTLEARITNYGGIITALLAPDRHGQPGDVVLGYDHLEGYIKKSPYFGALVGRYGNRIANARFTLGGATYQLPVNNGPNCLHGGKRGFDKVVWEAKPDDAGPSLELNYLSKDGEEGFPGNLRVKAVYSLTEDNGLRLDYTATTDKETAINLTQHTYFNLAGQGDVLRHEVFIDADRFTPVDEHLIPTGELKSVAGTPFDFRQPTAIGARINQPDHQLQLGLGYDHNYVLNHPPGGLDLIARAHEPTSGRVLETLTTEPGVQFYTGNHLDGSITGKNGVVYKARHGFCLETQHFPDSPNKPNFPSAFLQPGQTYQHTIIYRFSTR